METNSIITARKRSLRRSCFYRCLSVHGGGSPCRRSPCQAPPAGRPPGKETPPWQGDPPGKETPRQGDPPSSQMKHPSCLVHVSKNDFRDVLLLKESQWSTKNYPVSSNSFLSTCLCVKGATAHSH